MIGSGDGLMKLVWMCMVLIAATLLAAMGVAQAATVSVSVTDHASGAPLSKAIVAVVAGSSVLAVGRTGPDGTWNGSVADGGQAYVVVTKDLHTPTARQVTLSGSVSQGFALDKLSAADFTRLGRIVGFVRSASGQPLGNATLVLLRGGTPVGVTQPENATGVYELEWYAPGTYTVLATAPGYNSATYSSKLIAAGESLWLDIALQPR